MVKIVKSKEEWTAAHKAAGDLAVLVDFYADWCGPCKMIAGPLETLSQQFEGKLIFLKLNVDEVEDVAAECEISAMPTFQIWKDGAKVDQLVGANLDKLNQLITKYAKTADA